MNRTSSASAGHHVWIVSALCRVGILVGLFLLLCFSVERSLEASRTFFAEDQALTFAVGRQVAEGQIVLLGPPSHVGGRHLGPWMYYLAGGALKLAGGDLLGALTLCSALTIMGFLLLVFVSPCLAEMHERFSMVVATFASLAIGEYLDVASSFWHSNLLLVPALSIMLSGALLLAHGWRFLPLFGLCASLCFQLHFSSLPLILAFLLTWPLFARSTLPVNGWRCVLASPGAAVSFVLLAALSWVPALWFEYRFGHNLADLAAGLSLEHGHAGIREAVVTLCRFFWRFFAGGVFSGVLPFRRVAFVALVLFALFLGRGLLRHRSVAVRRGSLALLLSVPLFVLMLARQEAPLYEYYLYSLLPLPVLATGYAVVRLIGIWKNRALPIVGRVFALTALIALAAALGNFALARHTLPYKQNLHRVYTLRFAEQVAADLQSDRARRSETGSFSIVGFNALKLTRDAIYYFLGPEFFPYMHYSERFLELEPLVSSATRQSYLVICPKLDWKSMRRVTAEVGKEWQLGDVLTPPVCASCGTCFIRRIER